MAGRRKEGDISMKRIVAEGIEAGALGATAVATWF